ncbi:MAG: MobF family relaxase, partial [Acidimicrobiales bacterium]
MLSIGKLAGGAEDYYLASVARGQEEYYIGAGEAPGYWLGKGAASLCLEGEVEAEVLRALLAGRLPRGCSPAKLAGDPKRRVAGFDLTFSAPKSVSLLYGLSSEDVSLSVREAHDEAVASALCYLEAHGTRARRGAGGATRIPTAGLVGAAFRHRTSRAGDPQLHTHVLCANLVQGDDGRWSAPDARLLYYQGRAAGYLYQAVLRHELARRLGVRFGPIRTGAAEIEGISPAVMRAFSTRRAAIEERLGTWGLDTPSAARVAALDTRPAKQPPPRAVQLDLGSAKGPDGQVHAGATPDIYVAADPASNTDTESATNGPGALRETWQAKAAALGFHPGSLADLLGRPRSDPPGEGCRANIVAELLSPAGLTAQVSSFERRDVICQVAARLPDGAPATVLELLADEVMSAPE